MDKVEEIFGWLHDKSENSRAMIEEYCAQGKRLGIKCNKMNYSMDKDKVGKKLNHLFTELDARWLNPIIVCYSDMPYRHFNADHSEIVLPMEPNQRTVQRWFGEKYEAFNIVYHFHGEAQRGTAPSQRTEFNGAHFTTSNLVENNYIIDDSRSMKMGIGFIDRDDTMYLVDNSSWLYFADDCLAFGIFDLERSDASMRISGDGWHEFVGVPVVE